MNRSSGKGREGRGTGQIPEAILPHLAADEAWEPAEQGSSPRALRSTPAEEPPKPRTSTDISRS